MYPPQWPGVRAYTLLTETESTNTDLKNRIRASRDPVFEVLCATRQTGGRGRLGRSFYSPEGGVYFSASFPLCSKERNPAFLSLLAGLAAAETLQAGCGAQILLKWPNDLFLNGKKLCGILTEYLPDRHTAVVGIGVNTQTRPADIPPQLQDVMTSLAAEGFHAPESGPLVREIVTLCDRWVYTDGALLGKTAALVKRINARSLLTGKRVEGVCAGKSIVGVARQITEDGALELLLPDGGLRRVSCGEILLCREGPASADR